MDQTTVDELIELLSPLGNFRTSVFDSQKGGDEEFAIFFDGMPRFLTESEMRESDLLDMQADDEAAIEAAFDHDALSWLNSEADADRAWWR